MSAKTQMKTIWGKIRVREVQRVDRIQYVPPKVIVKAKTVKCAKMKQLMGDIFPYISSGIAARLVAYAKAPLYDGSAIFEQLVETCGRGANPGDWDAEAKGEMPPPAVVKMMERYLKERGVKMEEK